MKKVWIAAAVVAVVLFAIVAVWSFVGLQQQKQVNEEMMELVFDILQLSRDLEKHAEIEEMLLLPPEDYQLSDREQEVLELVAQGLSSKEIGSRLNIAVNTVNTHRKSITKKTGIKSVAGLAVYAMLKHQ